MAYIYRKVVGGKDYYYLRASVRSGTRIIAKDIAYLGNTPAEAQKTLASLPQKAVRSGYKSIQRFFERNVYLERAKAEKHKTTPFLPKDLLEQVEACRIHYQSVFLKHTPTLRWEALRHWVIDYAFNTTSIEGNTITLQQAARLLNDNLTPKNKTLREIHDIHNTDTVFHRIFEQPPAPSHDTIKSIHTELMTNIDNRAGYRTGDVHVYRARFDATPAPYIKADIDILLKWHATNKNLHPLVHAGIVHHKFEQIHPFYDGNGRTGRMLLNAILLTAGYPPVIIQKKHRASYLDALSQADKSDLTTATPEHYKRLITFLATEYIETYWNTFL